VEAQLKLLYTGMTRAQRRLNLIETGPSKAASSFLRAAGNQVTELSFNSTIETNLLTPDEWVGRGLAFAWEASEHTSRAGGVRKQDLTVALTWLNRSIECFHKAANVGVAYECKAHVHIEVLRFLHKGIQTKDDEVKMVQLVKTCIIEGMWLEADSLVSLLVSSSYHRQQSEFYQSLLLRNVQTVLSTKT